MKKNEKEFILYFLKGKTCYEITYRKIDTLPSQKFIPTKNFKVPLDELLIEGLYSEDKIIKNMTFEILKHKYEG